MNETTAILIPPSQLSGSVAAIPSKSDGHRQLICAALSNQETTIEIGPDPLSQDVQTTINCIRSLGARVMREDDRVLRIHPIRTTIKLPPEIAMDCGESGSTLRFLVPVVAAQGKTARFTGEGKLPERPMDDLMDALRDKGITFSDRKMPFVMSGKLRGGTFSIPGNISSQYISGLLFALPLLDEDSEIILTSPLESADYVKMTLNTLRAFEINVESRETGFFIPGRQMYSSPGEMITEGDWSNAAFFLAAGALNAPVNVSGLSPKSLQPDAVIIDTLGEFGCDAIRVQNGYSVFPKPLKGILFSARNAPDLVPVLSVVACGAVGTTQIVNAGRLRLKESDRLLAMVRNLTTLGADISMDEDSLTINGTGKLRGGVVDGFNDHRIVMSMAIASTIAEEPIEIRGWEAVRKSYPTFFEDFRLLGGVTNVLDRS